MLVDLGFEDAEELTAKASLAVKFNELVETRGLSQTEAAAITGVSEFLCARRVVELAVG